MTLWLIRSGTGCMAQGRINADDEPCPSIMAGGLGGGNCSQYWLEEDGKLMKAIVSEKPPYRVPLMSEIAAFPRNGLKVASTFSGCGGSCLGYRMAGFKVIWANEFVPTAQACYRANFPETILDPRDIKIVQAEDILKATGLSIGELDLFDGSPPCQAFSTAGKRDKGWGKGKRYEHGAVQKNELLFTEYIRLVRGLQPKVFIAENVSGLIKGKAKGFFKQIFGDLKACGYRVESRLLDAQWLGVPQMRQRIIFIGVRNDLGLPPTFPKPLAYRYSVRDALPLPPGVRVAHAGRGCLTDGKVNDAADRPSAAIRTTDEAQHVILDQMEMIVGNDAFEPRWGSLNQPSPARMAGDGARTSGQIRIVHDESGTFSQGDVTEQPAPIVRSGRAATMHIQSHPSATVLTHGRLVPRRPSGMLGEIVPGTRRKFTIGELKRICAFPDDFILVGSYAQQWERLGNSVPPVMMRHIAEVVRDRILLVVPS